jgi:hypothetical protein
MTEARRYVRSVARDAILVPKALIDTRITEVEKHVGDSLTLIIFFDSNTGDRRRKLVELQKTLDKLDLTVPSTGTTVILSSYQTWACRTTREIDLDVISGNENDSNDILDLLQHLRLGISCSTRERNRRWVAVRAGGPGLDGGLPCQAPSSGWCSIQIINACCQWIASSTSIVPVAATGASR